MKVKEITFIKTIMMLIIVLYHSCLFFGNSWFTYVMPIYNAKYLYLFATWLNTFHVHTFVMASGFLFYYLKCEKGKYHNYKNDIKKRAKRLLLPYIFVSLIWIIPISEYFFKYSFAEIIKKFILCVSPAQLWFLIMLFGVFLVFEFISDKIKISIKNLIIIYFLSVIISLGIQYLKFDYFQLSNVFKYTLFFYLGGFLYKYKEHITLKKCIILIIGVFILLFTTYLLNDGLIEKVLNSFLLQLISLCEVVLLYKLGDYLINKKNISLKSKLYKLLEDNSFGIYLFHQQIMYFIIVFFNGKVIPIVQVFLSFSISLLLSLALSLLLKKSKVTKVMFGL